MSYEPVELLIIVLGTNDTKDRLGMNAACIALGMERLVRKAMSVDCWGPNKPNVLIVCPPPIGEGMFTSPVGPTMGAGCREKSLELPKYYKATADLVGAAFMDAAGCEFNTIDYMHLTKKGHAQLAEKFAQIIPTLL
jgi:lysophospholipase L1-like esterase